MKTPSRQASPENHYYKFTFAELVSGNRLRKTSFLEHDEVDATDDLASPGQWSISYSSGPGGGHGIVLLTRSVFAIMFELAMEIDVPAEHDAEGQVVHVPPEYQQDLAIRVATSLQEPDDAFVSVEYEGNWFYISKKDLHSKQSFTFLRLLMSFTETGTPALPTLVTVPA